MYCPSCHALDTRVVDTRIIEEGGAIRRRRLCEKCGFRFSTTEHIEILSLTVEKNDGSEEQYDQEKVIRSLHIALQKRPVTPEKLKRTVNSIERVIQSKAKKDRIRSQDIGEIVMKHLKRLDTVAYIRFASVYRSFEDVDEFADELEKLARKKRKQPKISTKKSS